jgi:hypothetical protein
MPVDAIAQAKKEADGSDNNKKISTSPSANSANSTQSLYANQPKAICKAISKIEEIIARYQIETLFFFWLSFIYISSHFISFSCFFSQSNR